MKIVDLPSTVGCVDNTQIKRIEFGDYVTLIVIQLSKELLVIMSVSQKQLIHSISEVTIPEARLQSLVNKSIEVLEKVLMDETLSTQEKTKIATQILEIEKREIYPTDRDESVMPEWKRWVAESKFHGNSDDTILYGLLAQGIDHGTAKTLIHDIAADPCYQAGHHFVQLLRKLESMLKVEHELTRLSPKAGTIERRSNLSKEEFLEKYYATNTPVIVTDMMHDWQAIATWTPEYFKTQFGDVEVEVQVGRDDDPQHEVNKGQHKRKIRFADYVDMVTCGGNNNDYYMVASNRNLERPEFQSLLEDLKPLPEFLNSQAMRGPVKLWFGPAGTITPVHHDQVNVLAAHICGRKRWRLVSPHQTSLLYNYLAVFSKVDLEHPNLEQFPLLKDVDVLEVVLKPGEMIFVPIGWWHHVKALDVSISLSFMNFVFPNKYKYENPNIPAWWNA